MSVGPGTGTHANVFYEIKIYSWILNFHVFSPEDKQKMLKKKYQNTTDYWANISTQLCKIDEWC